MLWLKFLVYLKKIEFRTSHMVSKKNTLSNLSLILLILADGLKKFISIIMHEEGNQANFSYSEIRKSIEFDVSAAFTRNITETLL